MGDGVYANLDAQEGTLTGTTTLTFKFRARRVVITNDSASADLSFKFNATESYATLKPTETVSLQHLTKTVLLSGTGVTYRVWGTG